MYCNTPVVSTDMGIVREMIGDIEGAYVTNTFETKDLADSIDKVLKLDTPFNGRVIFLAKGYGMVTVAEKLNNIHKQL